LTFPVNNSNKQFNAVFVSPPWGGTGYNLMDEYALEHIFPDFDHIVDKASDFSPNLMLFLPRNTSIDDLVKRLAKFQNKLLGEIRKDQISDSVNDVFNNGDDAQGHHQKKIVGELAIEI